MSFPYKHVLMVGATSGIGVAMADRLVQEGSKVIAVGRRQDRLDEFVKKHGDNKTSAVKFDISERQNIDQFVDQITKSYPGLDCVFLNAGIQGPHDFTQPEKFNLSGFHSEISTNFSAFVDLTIKFLPFLTSKKSQTSLIYTSSGLGFVPAPWLPAYSASKAALSAFVLCLRDQLRNSSVKVIDLWPPVVQTELHDYMGEERGRSFGMPLQEFTDKAYEGLISGKDQVTIGSVARTPAAEFNDMIDRRRAAFVDISKMLRGE